MNPRAVVRGGAAAVVGTAIVLTCASTALAAPVDVATYCLPTDPGLDELSGATVLDGTVYGIGDSGADDRVAVLDANCAVQRWIDVPVDPYDVEDMRTMGWTLHGNGRTVDAGAVVAPDERLSWPRTVGIGMQHVVAMFGATLLVPTITGFPVSTTLLFSGIGTALFLIITRGRVPSYLGSSFAFLAPLGATAADGPAAQLGAVLCVGVVLAAIGFVVKFAGARVLDAAMPPVVTGAVVVLIGLNLAPAATTSFEAQPLVAAVTLVAILLATAVGPGLVGRLGILLGVVVGWVFAAVTGGIAQPRLDALSAASWIGLPEFRGPSFQLSVILVALPVVIVLVAENVGHVKAVAAMTGKNLDDVAGDALIADGLATTLAGAAGGSGTTTYAENIGVMGNVTANGPFVVSRGEGAYIFDNEGNRYLDATAGLWFTNVGHGRREIADAVAAQLSSIAHYSNFGDFVPETTLALADRLAAIAPVPGSKIFFTSGGSDSIDTAAKLARRYWVEMGQPSKKIIVGRQKAYHGMRKARR